MKLLREMFLVARRLEYWGVRTPVLDAKTQAIAQKTLDSMYIILATLDHRDHNVTYLRSIAQKAGIKYYASLPKAELLERICNAIERVPKIDGANPNDSENKGLGVAGES